MASVRRGVEAGRCLGRATPVVHAGQACLRAELLVRHLPVHLPPPGGGQRRQFGRRSERPHGRRSGRSRSGRDRTVRGPSSGGGLRASVDRSGSAPRHARRGRRLLRSRTDRNVGCRWLWGLPEYPRTPYYRTFETSVDSGAHLYEFVVPMVPPTWNDRSSVEAFATRLHSSSSSTAVAVSILDVCQPADSRGDGDYYAHWGLTHFLLDGHHKMEAAASEGLPLRLLSLLSVDASLATPDLVLRVPDLLRKPPATRI